ncbi:hypothetical protein SDC9_177962 [bioreactor metagenome]|uniref:Uncharacterized protein n=1 Tax=bioreactor metagenome TaxID=1076179 RepID=A0A645GUF6_9ZZZZ
MPALEQRRARAQRQQRVHRVVQFAFARNLAAQQPARFVQIGRHHLGQREELVHQSGFGLLRDQPVAASGHHHRVEHHMRQLITPNRVGHHMHHLG